MCDVTTIAVADAGGDRKNFPPALDRLYIYTWMLVYVCVVAASGGDIEHFSHDLLLCSLFMLHFKGLSVIINSRPKQNECVSRDGGVAERRSRLKYWVGSCNSAGNVRGSAADFVWFRWRELCVYVCIRPKEGRVEKGFRFPQLWFQAPNINAAKAVVHAFTTHPFIFLILPPFCWQSFNLRRKSIGNCTRV